MAIAFDASSGGKSNTPVNSITYSHTTSGSDRLLVVCVHYAGDNFSSVTYNGVALTTALQQVVSFITYGIYYLVAPASGTHNVVVSNTGSYSQTFISSSISFTGVDQSSPLDTTGSGTQSSSTSNTVTMTTTESNTVLVDMAFISEAGATMTPGSGQTEFYDDSTTNGQHIASSYKIVSSSGSNTMSYSKSGSNWPWRSLAAAFVDVEQPSAATDNAIFFANNF